MAQLQQIHKKHLEQQQRQQHHNNNNNSNLKERNNTLSQLLEKNRGERIQPTKAALTMPPSFQRGGERSLSGSVSMHSPNPFGSLPSHMSHMPVKRQILIQEHQKLHYRKVLVKTAVPNLLGLKSRRHVLCTFLVPCDIKTVINIPIWQLFWSHLDLLQVPVPGLVPVESLFLGF